MQDVAWARAPRPRAKIKDKVSYQGMASRHAAHEVPYRPAPMRRNYYGRPGRRCLRQPKIDLSRFRNAGYERRLVLSADLGHLRQSGDQHLGHLRAIIVSRREIKLAYSMAQNCGLLQLVVSDFLVLGDQHPAILPHERKPLCVFCTRRKMAAVTLVLHAILDERVEDGFAVVKIFVEI